MKVSISQPMFLPWSGFFNQIAMSDLFIHYDDVQFSKGSFVNRVQLKDSLNYFWLNIPIMSKFGTRISEINLPDQIWKKKHINTLKQIFAKRKFANDVMHIVFQTYNKEFSKLSDFNIFFIESVSKYLGLKTKFFKSSDLNLKKTSSSEDVLNILKFFSASEYITGHGAKNYLDHDLLEKNKIKTFYMNYKIKQYKQKGSFTPFLTVLDMISHLGKDSIASMESNKIYWKDFI